jgi:hypothetical protein
MTDNLYTLEEAADQLGLSKTILMRMSQYFKMPQSAYTGHAQATQPAGNPVFTRFDIRFFNRIKDRLSAGETLVEIKEQLQTGFPDTLSQSLNSEHLEIVNHLSTPSTLTSIDNPGMYHSLVDKKFEHYKRQHHPGLSPVFKKLLKELGSQAEASRQHATFFSKPLSSLFSTFTSRPPRTMVKKEKPASQKRFAKATVPQSPSPKSVFFFAGDTRQEEHQLLQQALDTISQNPYHLTVRIRQAAQTLHKNNVKPVRHP